MLPWEIFTPPSRVASLFLNASSFRPRPDLYPPANVGWSIGILEDLSALADQFQAQTPPAQQEVEAADNPLLGARIAQTLIIAVDRRIKRQTRTTGKGAATVTHIPKRPYLTCKDVKDVLRDCRAKAKGKGTAHAYEGDGEDEDMEEEGEGVEEEIEVGAEDEEEDKSEDQYTDEEGDMMNHQDDEGSEDSTSTTHSRDPSRTQNSGHGSVDKEPSLLFSPSTLPAAAAHALPLSNSQDEHVALVNLPCEASLPPLSNTMPTATAGTKAVTNATVTGNCRTINSVGINSTRQSQSSSSHTVPATSTPRHAPDRPTPSTALHSHELAVYTPPATFPQPLSVSNKRPRLSSHGSGQNPSTDQPGSSDAQASLIDNENGLANVNVVDMSSERGSSLQHLRLEDPESVMDNEELSAVATIRRQRMRFDKTATELQAMISHQRALNAEYKRTIAQEREISSRASALIKTHQGRLAAAKDTIERRAALQEYFDHGLDRLIKEDAMDPHIDGLKKIFSLQKDYISGIRAKIPKMLHNLTSAQEKWRCSQKDQATAADHLELGTKMTGAMVATYNVMVAKKRRWDHIATCVHTRPDEPSPAVDDHSIAAEDLHEARMDLAHDEQEAAP